MLKDSISIIIKLENLKKVNELPMVDPSNHIKLRAYFLPHKCFDYDLPIPRYFLGYNHYELVKFEIISLFISLLR